jgi:abortive infection bacteriophage resistance protein
MCTSKPALTREEMITLLKTRELKFNSESEAIEIFKRLNYQKLMAYRFKFLKDPINFLPDSTFEAIYNLYKFDRDLKFLILELIESIELALRTQIAYELGHKYGIHCQFNNQYFNNSDYHESFLQKLEYKLKPTNDERPLMVKHHQNKYNDLLPIYKFIELPTFGQLSKLFKNLLVEDKDQIVNNYYKSYHKVNPKHITSWLLTITEVRNTCAHHEKLFDNVFEISSLRHKVWKDISTKTPNGKEIFSIYAIFLIFKYLIQDTELFNESIDNLNKLFKKYSTIINPIEDLKFPENWKDILKL